MAVYTRQSSSGIVDGGVIEAVDLNNEFDQLAAAFLAPTFGVGTSGTDIVMTFDGETNDGVITWMEDEDLFKFSDAINVGVDDTGHDVKFFGATSGKYWLWDESADGVVQIGSLTVGVDDAGHDVKFFGDTASAYMLWDTSTDDLVLAGSAGIDLAGDIDVDGTANLDNTDIDGTLAVDGTTISLDATTSLNIDNSNTSNGITLGTATSGVPISIGHTTSEVTVNDNLTVTGTLTLGSGAELTEAELEFLDGITAGTVAASKAVVVDANKDAASFRNITLTGELDAGSLDVSGDADIDGTLEADAITIGGTAIGSIYSVIAGSSSIVTTGALNSGSITSGFGTIDTGSSAITTTGLISGGSLDIDDVVINGTTIGHTDDTDLITVADGVLTIAGDLTVTGDDITMGTNTSGAALIADGTNFNPVVISGDISIGTDGVAAIGSGVIVAADIASSAVTTAKINADAVTGAKIADDAIDSEHYTDGSIDNAHIADDAIDSEHYAAGSIDTAHIADDQVTLAKMAGLARGKIIYGDSSGDPAALAVGSNGYVLTSDGTDVAWAASSVSGLAADNLTAGDAAVTLSTTSGNITIDATANDSDIIFKGTDATSDITMLTLDGSEAGKAIFNAGITIADAGTIGSASDADSISIASDGVVTMNQIPVFSAGINVSGGSIAGTLSTAAQANVTSLGTLTALTVDDVAVNGKVITMTGSASDTAVITAGTNGTLDITTTDAAAAAANISITADGTFEVDATTITLDSAGDIALDAAGNNVTFKSGGTSILDFSNSSSDAVVTASVQDKDIIFKGDDGGSAVTALTMDMSAAGKSIFGAAAVGKTDTDTSNSGSITLDFDTNQNFVLTATGNITLANPTTESVGQSGIIVLIQDGTGSRTLSTGSDFEWPAGTAGTISTAANAIDIIPYFVDASNSILLGAPQLAFATPS